MRILGCLILLLLGFHSIFAQHKISTTPWKQLVPSDRLPKEFKIRKGNNNLDATRYKGRYYVAFRTAPSHFASKKTRLYLMSSEDLEQWEYETEFYIKSDMREPRFLVYHDTLFFYFFQAGNKPLRFQPKKCWVSYSLGDKEWAKQQDMNMDGYVPWRYRVRDDTIYLSAYYGVNLYRNNHQPDLKLFRSTDGFHYEPISESSQIPTKGGEEGEFEFDKEGNLWATVRLEGSGAYIAYADKDSLHHWKHWFTKQKYDSALMLNHEETFYVFARRHLKGNATKTEFPNKRQRRRNLIRYSLSKKKTAMYRLNKEEKRLEHIMDFPSTGDNAFPAIAKINENQYFLLNYSNDFTKKERNWIGGQIRRTNIYWTILTIED